MAALKMLQQETLTYTGMINAQLLSGALFVGLLLSLLLLKKIYVKSAIQSLSTKPKKYRYPQRQVNQYVVSFEGNVKSFNTKTGRITTHKYEGKRENERN